MKIGYFLVFFIIRGCSQVSSRCPIHWLENSEGNSCYRFSPTRTNIWTDAGEACRERDGDLLKLNSKQEKEWVVNEIKKYPVNYEWWIGLQRHPGNDSIWLWTDGTSRNKSETFIPWGSGEPNNYGGKEDCVVIWNNLLNDRSCNLPHQFICERPKDLPMKCDVDNGWDDVTSTHCYKFFSDKLTYGDAVSKCSDEDASLLTINGTNVQQKITDFLDYENNSTVWLQYQFDTNNSFNWSSLETGVANNDGWNNSVPGAQIGLDNHTLCSVMDSDVEGKEDWKPESCNASNSFLCQKVPGVCPYGYIQHTSTCYLLNTQDFMTWDEARGFCNLRSTKLMEIKNNSDWYYVLSMIKSHFSVTGIKSVWLGVSGKDIDSLKWDSGDEIDDFVKTISTGKLSMAPSGTQCGFIDTSFISGTAEKSSWKFGDCGGSGGAICTNPVNHRVRTPPPQKPRYECPDGYTLNGVICYRWNPDDSVDWYTAREKCAKEGADLVTIRSEEEQAFVLSHIQSESWIGLNDRREEGIYNWLDTTAEVGVTNWFSNQPNNITIGDQYSENCVAMLYLPGHETVHGKWVDYPCSYKAKLICQLPAEWNIALGKIASQSSLYNTHDSDAVAENAIDGCSRKSLNSSSCCSRTDTEDNPWWMLDLGTYYSIGKIVIHRRSEEPSRCPDCLTQFRNFRLFISNTSQYKSTDESDMVYQEQRDQIPAVVIIYLKNVTVGRYVRIDIPRSSESLRLCEVKVYQGESLQRSLSPTNSNCITNSTKWAGDVRHTVSGKACQAWNLDTPHKHSYHDKTFPDGTEDEAENFCRDPMGEGWPWCYTVDPDVRWEFCPVTHCTSEVASIDPEVQKENTTDCGTGWIENQNTGACNWFGEEILTWADAQSVCESVGASLTLPRDKNDLDFLTGSTSPTKNRCVTVDKTGTIRTNNCLDRNVYSCMKMGPYIKYTTSSNGSYKELPTDLINKEMNSSKTTYKLKFEFKGYDGATLKLHSTSDLNDGYIIRIGGNLFAKSSISILGSKSPKLSRVTQHLYNEDEFKDFWIQWTNGKTNGDTIAVGRGKDVGRSMFMQWTDPTGIQASSVSFATVMKTSVVYKGYWKFPNEKKNSKQVEAVNLALNKPAKQISSYPSRSGPEKAVDGCKKDTYSRRDCASRTESDKLEPWWEVDLGQVYPIKEVVIYTQRNKRCRLYQGETAQIQTEYEHDYFSFHDCYLRLIISMFSDSTLEEDVVYNSASQDRTSSILHIPAKGKRGRYVKIDIPGRTEALQLVEVEVYEDIDASRCGSGWLDYSTDDTCYKFSDVQMNWNSAKLFCDGLNSAMVVPKTPKEQLFLYEKSLSFMNGDLKSKSVWLGLHYTASNGSFQTSDGSTLTYTNWGRDEPNDYDSGEDCGAFRIDWSRQAGRWTDENCNAELRAVCKTAEPETTVKEQVEPVILSQGDCKADWTYSPVSSSCLRIFKNPGISFYSAASKCITLSSRLTSIENGMEQTLIAEMIDRSDIGSQTLLGGIWSGGIDYVEGKWQWFMDNSTWHSSVRWHPGEPNNYRNNEDCAVFLKGDDTTGLLNDVSCDKDKVGYICKYRLGSKKCKHGWIYNGRTDTCYKLELHNQASWNDARLRCSQENGILATIRSKEERLFMKALVASSKRKGVWVGAHCMQEKGIYQWIDGSKWKSDMWAPDQPNNWNSNQNCIMVDVSGTDDETGFLNDAVCDTKSPYICAIKGCATGWKKYETNCYLFSLTNRSWDDAKAFCEHEGSRLLIVEDEKEHNFIRQNVRDTGVGYMWIGARYYDIYGEHRWIDGSPMTLSAWGPGQPGPVKGCVDYLGDIDYLWNSNSDCVNTKGPFICEKAGRSGVGLPEPTVPTATTKKPSAKTTTARTSLENVADSQETGLSDGQIAGITTGVIVIVILGVLVYIFRSRIFKSQTYPFEMHSHGFDNALFHKSQDTISIS